ncbi:MAG TPA: Xaa-Pro peptidase family protein [Acidimicrobiales bacterium]|nr:Xaa-Pro peptidase family protein [Acidimicrobiales bacterium]
MSLESAVDPVESPAKNPVEKTVETVRPMDVASRLVRLRALLEGAGLDALLVTNLVNVRYLTGFGGSAANLLVGSEEALLLTDGRYRTQAEEQVVASGLSGAVEIFVGKVPAQREELAATASRTGAHRVGLEAENVTWGAERRIAELLFGAELVPTEGLVERLREVKDEGELDRMALAAAIADAALGEVLGMLRAVPSEEELALALDTAMRRLGAEDRAFDTIIASGPNSAKPHARPSSRPITAGDWVVIDFGATYDGYRSDMTRTFCVGGRPEGEMGRVFETVARSQSAGVAAVRSGIEAGEVDRACRDLISDAGWAELFEHGTGHGVGLDIHEAPTVSEGSTAILAPGCVVTVEPGVYLRGVGGVRIEDTVVVTEEGCRTLTGFTKDPVVLAG